MSNIAKNLTGKVDQIITMEIFGNERIIQVTNLGRMTIVENYTKAAELGNSQQCALQFLIAGNGLERVPGKCSDHFFQQFILFGAPQVGT